MMIICCKNVLCYIVHPQGLTVLFHGASGTGKTLAAEAIGYEVGKPLKVTKHLFVLSEYFNQVCTSRACLMLKIIFVPGISNCMDMYVCVGSRETIYFYTMKAK